MKKTIIMGLLLGIFATIAITTSTAISETHAQIGNRGAQVEITTGQAGSNSQGSAHACPPNTISFTRGTCLVETTTTVPRICPNPPGTTCAIDPASIGQNPKFIVTFPSTDDTLLISQYRNTCASLGGMFNDQVQPFPCTNVSPICPPGSTEQGQSCVTSTTTTTKPGQGNRP